MDQVVLIGLDLAKQVFQVHGVDANGKKLFNKKLRRDQIKSFFASIPACSVAMEAGSATFHWAREIEAFGHKALIIPPQYVKPFRKRGKTDAADAEAIAIAAAQSGMRFVPVKTVDQQALTAMIRTRFLFVRQRTKAINALRGHLAEFGVIAKNGISNVEALAAVLRDEGDSRLPAAVRAILCEIYEEIETLSAKVARLDKEIAAQAKKDEDVSRLMSVPGIGTITAVSIKAYAPDVAVFKSARHFASWLGVTPEANSSGGKSRSGEISRRGNALLRSLLFVGAIAVVRTAKTPDRAQAWLKRLIDRRPYKVAAMAVANKIARIVWALLKNRDTYRETSGLLQERPAV